MFQTKVAHNIEYRIVFLGREFNLFPQLREQVPDCIVAAGFTLLDYMITYSKDRAEKPVDTTRQYVKNVISYIQLNYTNPIKIEAIAYACGLNRSYLTRLFKEATGYSLQEYLGIYRMKIAAKMLAESNLPVQAIASKVGYGDAFTFTKAFKRHTGKSPTEYRSSGGSITMD